MPYTKAIAQFLSRTLHVPIWWYTSGLVDEIKKLGKSISEIDYFTGFSVWLKNIFVPMYGQRDWKGRLISFLVRLFQVIVRGVVFCLLFSLRSIITILYISLPIILLAGLINSIND